MIRILLSLTLLLGLLLPHLCWAQSPEEKAREKVNRRFERQHQRLVKRIEKILKTYSERDLREMFKEHSINTGNMIESSDLRNDINLAVDSYQSIKAMLKIMTTDDYKNKLRSDLESEIQKAGSAKIYLNNLEHRLNINWCGVAKTSLGIMAIPISAAGLVGMVYLSFWTAPITGAALLLGWSTFSGLSYPVLIKDCKFNPPAESPE